MNLKGHKRLPLCLKYYLYIYICLEPNPIKLHMNAKIMKTQFFLKRSMTSKVIEGHIRSLFYSFYPFYPFYLF